jgi:hypothetical protein
MDIAALNDIAAPCGLSGLKWRENPAMNSGTTTALRSPIAERSLRNVYVP